MFIKGELSTSLILHLGVTYLYHIWVVVPPYHLLLIEEFLSKYAQVSVIVSAIIWFPEKTLELLDQLTVYQIIIGWCANWRFTEVAIYVKWSGMRE